MSHRIRVLQLGSPTGLYGAERWILALVKYLNPERIESIIAVIRDSPELEASLCIEAKKNNIQTKIFNAYGKVNFDAVKQLRDFIRNNNINILQTHGYKTDIIGLLATFNTSCKILTTPHGWTKKPSIKLRCYELLDRLVFLFFDAVVPLSFKLYSELRKIPFLRKKLTLDFLLFD